MMAWGMVFVIVIGVTVPVLAEMNQTQNPLNDTSANNTTQAWNATGVFRNETITNWTVVNQTIINGTTGDSDTPPVQSVKNVTELGDNNISLSETLLANGTLTLLTPGTPDSDEGEPAIFNDTVVWIGKSEGRSVIFTYQVDSGNETIIVRDGVSESRPVIYKDRVVWSDYRNGNYDISLFNLTTRNVTHLTNDTVIQLAPSIYGDNVVWEDQLDGEDIVFLCNISSGTITRVSNASTTQFLPVISGNTIAWVDSRNENLDIYLFRLDDGNELQVTNDPADQIAPAIGGDHIVWVDTRNESSDIYLYNITTGSEIRLANEKKERTDPRISGDRVIWVDHEDPAHFISLYNITSGQKTRIIGDVGFEYAHPQIFGDRIVWAGGSGETTDIYMFTLGVNATCPIAGFTANRTLGEPPLTVRFNDTSTGQPDTWNWDFGDGNTSRVQDPVHTYTSAGSYNVTLSISTPYCRDVVGKEAFITCGVPPKAGFSANVTSGPAPVAIAFSDTSTGVPTSWDWDFGDNSSSVDQNPIHSFEKAGRYNVSLTARNLFGNNTTVKKDYITIVNGTRAEARTNITGLQVSSANATQHMTFDTQQIRNYTFDPRADNATMEFIPPSSSGLGRITLYSLNDTGFSWSGNSTIEGNVTKAWLQCLPLIPVGFSGETGKNSSVVYSLDLPGYPPNGSIESIIWEGITPDDYKRLSSIPDYAGVLGTAYTTQFTKVNMEQNGPATLVMGVNSTWVEMNGQRYGGTLDLVSYPDGVTVFIDGVIAGVTPIEVSLASGNHVLTFFKQGHDNQTKNVTVESARNSIKVIRIADDGSIAVLNTTFSYSSDEENLDYFEAYSPQGSSKFVLTALARSGNPLQLIYMSVTSHKGVIESYMGGGGGGGSSRGEGGSTAPVTMKTPLSTEPVTTTSVSVSEPVPAVSELTSAGERGEQGPAPGATEIPTIESTRNVSLEVPGSSIFPVLVNYIVVISAIAILSVGIYQRYKRGE